MLVTAQLILPGITALNLVRRVKRAVLLACVFSLAGSLGGFFAAHYLNLPLGATIVICFFILFVISVLIKSARQR